MLDVFGQSYHWSIRQAEYSTDLMFKGETILGPLYDALSRQAVLAAHAERVAGFLGKKVTLQVAQEIGSRLSTRIEGRCIKHNMGAASVKVYDKFGRVLRIETTINDVSFFKHHRKVEHRDGRCGRIWAMQALRHNCRIALRCTRPLFHEYDSAPIRLPCHRQRVAPASHGHSSGRVAVMLSSAAPPNREMTL